jgi:transcription elongation factor Elf1
MAVSTCIKCGGHSFELALFTPLGESNKLTMVQCANCGTLIGVMDTTLRAAIEALQGKVAAIDDGLTRIARTLND